jgi:hypothetical protein
MQAIEANAVSHVEPFFFVASPRKNVGCNEKFAHWQTGKRTAISVVVQNDLPEIGLTSALFTQVYHVRRTFGSES